MPNDAPIEVVNAPSHAKTYDRSHFSQAVKAGGLLFCSGVIGTGVDGKLPDDLESEFRNAFQGVAEVLALEGLSFSDIVEATTYHVDMSNTMGSFFSVREEFITPPWAAWTAIGCTELAVPGAHAEIRVIARLRT